MSRGRSFWAERRASAKTLRWVSACTLAVQRGDRSGYIIVSKGKSEIREVGVGDTDCKGLWLLL